MSVSAIILILASLIGIFINIQKKKAESQVKQSPKGPSLSDILDQIEKARVEERPAPVSAPHSEAKIFEEGTPATRASEVTITHKAMEGFEQEDPDLPHKAPVDGIAPRKLIIYSELMQPKWKEM